MRRTVQPNTRWLVRFFDHFRANFERGRINEECDFYKGSEFFGNGKCELNANFSATMVTIYGTLVALRVSEDRQMMLWVKLKNTVVSCVVVELLL